MATWYVKEFSKITNITVRTLHHYDRIGLLKPSIRLPNGYRVYAEADLSKVQPIISLRFFGFSLSTIRDIIKNNSIKLEHLVAQQSILDQKIDHLQSAAQLLKALIAQAEEHKTLNVKGISEVIEEYMIDELKKRWFGHPAKKADNLSEVSSKEEAEIKKYQKRWEELVTHIREQVDTDPSGVSGKELAKTWMQLLTEGYSKNPELKIALYSAFKNGKLTNPQMSKKEITWIEAALKSQQLEV